MKKLAYLFSSLLFITSAKADVPSSILYHGVLKNAAGTQAVEAGSYNITFGLWTDAESADTATHLKYQEAQTIAVEDNGLFSVLLGTGTPTANSPANVSLSDLDFNAQYYLSVAIGGDPDNDPELLPRVQFTASPYARNAELLDGVDISDILRKSEYDIDGDGKVDESETSDDILGTGTTTLERLAVGTEGVGIGATYKVANSYPVDGLAVEGAVGIGTSSPEASLHLQQSTAPTFRMTSEEMLTGTTGIDADLLIGTIDFEGQDNNLYRVSARIAARQNGTWSNSDNFNAPAALEFYTEDNANESAMDIPRMTIDSSGKVGIGEAAPAATLHIAGTEVRLEGDPNDLRINLQNTGGTAGSRTFALTSNANTDDLIIQAMTDNYGFARNIAAFQHDGNVGIGSLSPVSRLSVSGGVSIGSTYADSDAAPSNGLIIEGNVGIGTTIPETILHLETDSGTENANLPVLRLSRTLNDKSSGSGIGLEFNIDDTNNNPSAGFLAGISTRIQGEGSANEKRGNLVFSTVDDATVTDAMYVQYDGSVGIGTSSPSAFFHVNKASGDANMIIGSSDTGATDSVIQFRSNYTNLAHTDDITATILGAPDANSGGRIVMKTTDTSGTLTERLRIEADGEVIIPGTLRGDGSGIPPSEFGASTDALVIGTNKSGYDLIVNDDLWVRDNLVHSSSTVVSDKRLKENFAPIEGALVKILELNGLSFNLIEKPGERRLGLVAQDVQKILPEAVNTIESESGYLGISYTSIIPVLIEAVKELKTEKDAEIKALRDVNAAINVENGELRNELTAVKAEISSMRSTLHRIQELLAAKLELEAVKSLAKTD